MENFGGAGEKVMGGFDEAFYLKCSDLRNFPIICICFGRGSKVQIWATDSLGDKFFKVDFDKNPNCYYSCESKKPEPLSKNFWENFANFQKYSDEIFLKYYNNNCIIDWLEWYDFDEKGMYLAKQLKDELKENCRVFYIPVYGKNHLNVKTICFEIIDGKAQSLVYNEKNNEWVYLLDNS